MQPTQIQARNARTQQIIKKKIGKETVTGYVITK